MKPCYVSPLLLFLATASFAQQDSVYLGTYFYSRFMLQFKVKEAALEKLLPAGWKPSGEKHNLTVGFCDVWGREDSSGKFIPNSQTTYIPVNGTAKNLQTGETANFRYREYVTHPERMITAGTAIEAEALTKAIIYKRSVTFPSDDFRIEEEWNALTPDNGKIKLNIDFKRNTGQHIRYGMRVYYSTDTCRSFYYTNDEIRDIFFVQDDTNGRLNSLSYSITVDELSELFDGSELLYRAVYIPMTVRRVYRYVKKE